jgi:hypothetical protein
MSPNYRIITLVPSVGAASPYITISSTLTVTEVIFVASLAILAVPKVTTSPHWLGGLDNAGLASPSTLHHTPTRRTTHPNAFYQSLGIGLRRLKQDRARNHQVYRHNVKFCMTTFCVLDWFKDTHHHLCSIRMVVIHCATHLSIALHITYC